MQSDRRKKGTGSITKVNDALHAKKPWRASYLINKKRSYKFFAKESEARAFLRNLNADIRNTQALELQGVTFDGYAEEFLEHKRVQYIGVQCAEGFQIPWLHEVVGH